ncbi:hypothetical protein GCM10022245_14830 [Streptomyces mayteni]
MHTDAVLPDSIRRARQAARTLLAALGWLGEPGETVTVVTGLEGSVDPAEPVTCGYCRHAIVANDDHAVTCPWKPGKAVAR